MLLLSNVREFVLLTPDNIWNRVLHEFKVEQTTQAADRHTLVVNLLLSVAILCILARKRSYSV